MLKRIWTTYLTVGRTFGAWLLPLGAGLLFCLLRLAVFVGQGLDHLFFPRLRDVQVRKPIIIVGNPRTGTTFLQRFLHEQRVASGMELWRMLYPSLTIQKVLKPFLPILERISPARYHATAAHDTNLTSVETDDVAVLFRYLDGFFLYGFFLAFAEEDYRPWFDNRLRDTSQRDFAWLERLWKRNLVATSHSREVAKLFSLGPRTPAFLRQFPDAKILYMARDPLNIIPSGMSLVTGVLDKAFRFWSLPDPVRERYLERLYQALVELLRRFHEDYTTGRIPAERVKIVHYDRLMREFDTLMLEILQFVEIEPDDALRAELRRVAEKQRRYESGHAYNLARFGLSEERIREDCAFFYKTFLQEEAAAAPLQVAKEPDRVPEPAAPDPARLHQG